MTTSDLRPPIHPGEILREIYLEPLGMTRHSLAKRLLVSHTRINHLVAEKGKIDARLALRLARLLKTTPRFWLDMQINYDLKIRFAAIENELAEIKELEAA